MEKDDKDAQPAAKKHFLDGQKQLAVKFIVSVTVQLVESFTVEDDDLANFDGIAASILDEAAAEFRVAATMGQK